MSIIRGVYSDGVIKPKEKLDLEENTEVEIRVPSRTLEGMGKKLVEDEELEAFLDETAESLAQA
jgi:predicted DNA-binding antitoxin AbrB/MazE fold protein